MFTKIYLLILYVYFFCIFNFMIKIHEIFIIAKILLKENYKIIQSYKLFI